MKNILIVGGGIVGLTAARALRLRDFAVDLVEIKPDFAEQAGVGLTLVPNALRALQTIGLAQRCMDAGMPSIKSESFNADGSPRVGYLQRPGKRLGNLPSTSEPEFPAVGIGRAVLHRILEEGAIEAQATIHFGCTVHKFVQDSSKVAVAFSDGRESNYDLVIAADGIYSSIRRHLFPLVKPTFTGHAVWRAPAPRPTDVVCSQLYFGGRHGVVGYCPISPSDGYVYIVERAELGPTRFECATLHDAMRERLAGYGGIIPQIATQLSDPRTVSYRPIETLVAPKPWYLGRIVMIGDAAHAGPPVLAQGAAMGIEDAIVLAEELSLAEAKPASANVDAALSAFMERRYERAKLMIDSSNAIATWEVQPDSVDIGAVMSRVSAELAQAI
jgi:2-polyprenyl-6-methoxyphenol hydroxylase-like FAD-dependent oxidoreductase